MKTEKLDLVVSMDLYQYIAMNRANQLGWKYKQKAGWATESKAPEIPGEILFDYVRNKFHAVIIETNECVIVLEITGYSISIDCFGINQEANNKIIEKLKKDLPVMESTDEKIDVTFWYQTSKGPQSYDRKLEAPYWQDIENNYPDVTKTKLQSLKQIEIEKAAGKLILWQGNPGTGKTFAIRALAKEWREWCKVHYVLDPEQFFGSGDYLLSVILNEEDEDDDREKWRLVILEDSGELLRKDAKSQVGQGLSRLLNLCDGLLGQGLRILVLITTNEELGSLHDAISRPGRCLNQTSFDDFDAAADTKWLKDHNSDKIVNRKCTLADLYEIAQGKQTDKIKPVRSVGF